MTTDFSMSNPSLPEVQICNMDKTCHVRLRCKFATLYLLKRLDVRNPAMSRANRQNKCTNWKHNNLATNFPLVICTQHGENKLIRCLLMFQDFWDTWDSCWDIWAEKFEWKAGHYLLLTRYLLARAKTFLAGKGLTHPSFTCCSTCGRFSCISSVDETNPLHKHMWQDMSYDKYYPLGKYSPYIFEVNWEQTP